MSADPWKYRPESDPLNLYVIRRRLGEAVADWSLDEPDICTQQASAADVPVLLAEIERLLAEVGRLREHEEIRAQAIREHQRRLIAADAALAKPDAVETLRDMADRIDAWPADALVPVGVISALVRERADDLARETPA